MKRSEYKSNYPDSNRSEAAPEAQRLVANWSFAGYAKSGGYDQKHQPLAGEPLFWRTRTVRGPENIFLSDRAEGGMDIQPQHGTAIVVQSPAKTTAIVFQRAEKTFTATEYTVERMEGDVVMVSDGVQNILPKVWAATVRVESDSVAKVVNLNELSVAASVDPADVRQEFDVEQQQEFGVVYNALAAIHADAAAQQHVE